jgi:hypothetical protein
VKILLLEGATGDRYGWSFNGLAEIDGRQTTEWLASALFDAKAWNLSPKSFCAALADQASSSRAFRRISRVHTFVFAGWEGGQPAVGVVHNGDGPLGRGHPTNKFQWELAPRQLPGALVSGMDESLSEAEMWRLLEFLESRPSLENLQGRLEHMIRTAASRSASQGMVGQGVVSLYLPRDGSTVQERTHFPDWETSKIELPISVGPWGAMGFSMDLGQTIRFQTPQQERASRRRVRGDPK